MHRFIQILVLLLSWSLALAARALGTGTGNDSIPGYTGILVKSGGLLPGIPARGDYFVNNPSPTKSLSGTYRVGFKLVNALGTAASAEVFSPAFAVSLLPHTSTQGTKSVVLAPPLLTEGAPYRVSVQLYLAGAAPGSWTPAGPASTGSEYRFSFVADNDDSGVRAQMNGLAVTRAYAIDTAPASDSFQLAFEGVIGRRDQPLQPVAAGNATAFVDVTLVGDRTGPIALKGARTGIAGALDNHGAGGAPVGVLLDRTLDVRPDVQMDPTDTYTLAVTLSHAGPGGIETVDGTVTMPGQRFLHFNGTLLFGTVATVVTEIYNDPDFEGTVAGVGEHTALGIEGDGAFLVANPAYKLTTGQNFLVLLGIDGTASSGDGADISVPAGTVSTVAGVSFVPSGVTLNPAGFHAAGGTVRFPAGFGVVEDPDVRRLRAEFPVGAVELGPSLEPTGILRLLPDAYNKAHLYAVHEDLPEVFEASSVTWDTAAGTFAVHRTGTSHVRAAETAALDALPLTVETLVAKIRPSNDGYLMAPASGPGPDVVVRADAQGRAILDDATIDLPASGYTAHFPANVVVAWTQPGKLVVKGGAIDTESSLLPGASPAAFSTQPGAPLLVLAGGTETFVFSPTNGAWRLTADGGLRAEGAVAPGTVHWGARDASTFVQTAGDFGTWSALIPGTALRGASATSAPDQRPGELLMTGRGRPGDPAYIEQPYTPGYASGLADYPGLNARAGATGEQKATSLLGDGTLGPYPLSSATKYYIRTAGASGVHIGDRAFFAKPGVPFSMYGFALTLDDFQLACRDNVMVDSMISGTVDIPGVRGKPGFSQPFSKLFLDPQGEPGDLVLPQNGSLEQPLAYWHSRFHPLTAEFVSNTTLPKKVALVFGAEVLLPGIVKDPVRGGLGFLRDGTLASAKLGIPGVDSRMKPPKQVVLHGPGSAIDPKIPGFAVNPMGDFYFNDPSAAGSPAEGFVAFAGTIDVPFFEDLQVHVLARADTGRTSIRAWPPGPDGKNFFTDRNFDSGNVGFPSGKGYDAYIDEREPAGFEYYDEADAAHRNRNTNNPIARKSWLGFVDFALPLKWDAARRRFVSSVPEQRQFLVMTSERAVQQLTPSGAEIRFGLQFDKLPRLNLAAAVVDQNEVAKELEQFIPNGDKLAAAAGAFEKLAGGDTDKLVADAVDAIVDGLVDDMLGDATLLKGVVSANAAAGRIGVAGGANFEALRANLKNRFSGVAGAAKTADSIAGKIGDALDVVGQGLATADVLLAKNADGKRGAFIDDALKLAKSVGLPDEDIKPVTDQITSEINGPLAPTLDAIADSLSEVHDLSTAARSLVTDARTLTQGTLAAAKVADQLPGKVLDALRHYFEVANDPTGTLLAELGPEALRMELKKVARDAVGESDFVAQLQQTVRDLAEPLRDEFGGVNERIFGALNDIVRSAMEELSNQVIDHLNDDIGRANRSYGAFSKTLQLQRVEGSARIVGDSLDSAHVNATLGLYIPDKVALAGSIDFKHLRGEQAVPPCVAGSADGRMQITVSASGDASIGGGKSGHAEVHGQYTMDAKGNPLALSGGLSLKADLHVDIVSLRNADLEFAFGPGDNYVRGEGAGSILLFDVKTRAFFGRTCDPGLVDWIDPQIKELFDVLGRPKVDGANPLVGYYMMADGDVILNRILEIPDSVVLLKASGGQGNFIFTDPGFTAIVPGMHWRMGLSVGLGPLTAGAEFVALGGLDPIPLSLDDDKLPKVLASFLLDPTHSVHGAVNGRFTPEFGVGPASFKKDFDFTASGNYTAPPTVPPPGFFLVKKLRF